MIIPTNKRRSIALALAKRRAPTTTNHQEVDMEALEKELVQLKLERQRLQLALRQL
jgi:hypothetical protein